MAFAALLGRVSHSNNESSMMLAAHMANAPRIQSWQRWARRDVSVAPFTTTALRSTGLKNILGGSLDIVKSTAVRSSTPGRSEVATQTKGPTSKEDQEKYEIGPDNGLFLR